MVKINPLFDPYQYPVSRKYICETPVKKIPIMVIVAKTLSIVQIPIMVIVAKTLSIVPDTKSRLVIQNCDFKHGE